jgi:hypothetical protein
MGSAAINLSILVLAFGSWLVPGLGVVLALGPRARRAEAVLFAPVVGMCLLILAGLFQITVLLVPLLPLTNVALLCAISLMLCIRHRRALGAVGRCFPQRLSWLLAAPLLYLVASACLFNKEGLHLLVGASDQLQYCQNARHILEEMHTGSALDVPVPRQDHYVYEATTRQLCYLKCYRRGAEVLLATTTAVTGLSPEEAFPVTMIGAVLALGLALGYLGRVCLRLTPRGSVALQTAFLGGFCPFLLHVQGSLALTLAVPLSLVALVMLVRAVRFDGWRWRLFTGLLLGGLVSVYSEPVLVTVVLPTLLLIAREFVGGWSQGWAAARRVCGIYLVVVAIAPVGAAGTAQSTTSNLRIVCQEVTAGHRSASPGGEALSMRAYFHSPAWAQLRPILGAISYYDQSAFNTRVGLFVAREPWVGCAAFATLCGCGLLGFLRARSAPRTVFALLLAAWGTSCFLCAYANDYLRFMRSAQYALPFVLVGLVGLACRRTAPNCGQTCLASALMWAGRGVLLVFVCCNVFTCARTFRYLTAHGVSNDKIVLRYNERAAPWPLLREELRFSGDAPVLLSGFPDTVRPFMVACAIRTQPHVLGTSIARFWPLLGPLDSAGTRYLRTQFNTRLTDREFDAAIRAQNQPWSSLLPLLISQSVQAVVPVGHGFPEEWADDRDVYPPRRIHFENLCDVVYRHEYAAALPPEMTGPLRHDSEGPYRMLRSAGALVVHNHNGGAHALCLRYEGDPGDVTLHVKRATHVGERGPGRCVQIIVHVSHNETFDIALEVHRAVKLRSITWAAEETPAR